MLIDASFGFEMETFEFLNICQVHGFPRIMGVLTHLDSFKNNKSLRKTKKNLKHRFWTEVYQGAKLFYLSGMVYGEYQTQEVKNLGRFISVMKFRPLVSDVNFLPDPCPLPDAQKKRALNEKERLLYAPMAGVGGVVYDKDAVYIDLPASHVNQLQVCVRVYVREREGLEEECVWDPTTQRERRKVIFTEKEEEDDVSGESDSEEDDSEGSDQADDEDEPSQVEADRKAKAAGGAPPEKKQKVEAEAGRTESSAEMPAFADSSLRWKEGLQQKAAEAFLRQQEAAPNLRKLVYGSVQESEEEEEELGGLFRVSRPQKSKKVQANAPDCSRFKPDNRHNWDVEELNRAAFQDMDDESRVQYEGFRPGMYIRVEICSLPCEFVKNFDPHYPIILGGLGSSEGNIGFLQATFRIAATGVVLDLDKSVTIVKKLKLIGYPFKIFKNTCFVKPIVRAKRHFNPLHVPKELQKALPFKSKPKQQQPKGRTPRDLQRPSVIREPHERKVAALLHALSTVHNYTRKKAHTVQHAKHKEFLQQKEKDEEAKLKRQREAKKKLYRVMGQMDQKKQRSSLKGATKDD
ncbi:hypothetical protein GOODEAATRI_020536 [Goodea atripinnis]|uniref:Ribosome biogenesis protein BMS1/TSR1 C-terminal domain-containing protein n=1 Tax=Goodea atripinnis TaxID=208336 RepID=A0ABV0PFL5_9TELE